MATIGNAPVFPTESVLPGNLEVTGNATVSGNATISGSSATVNGDEVRTLGTSGAIVQVVQGSTSTQVGTTSNTLIDTGLSATITPTSSSNKIMVMVNQQGCYKDSNNTHGTIRLYRGTTFISMIDNRFAFTNSSLYINIGSVAGVVLDSPATTSAVTYKTQFSSVGNAAWVYVQNGTPTSTMTLIEVVA